MLYAGTTKVSVFFCTGHMVAMQIRPYAPEASRSIMWISYGSGPFTAATPFYANVDDTPAYLRDTTPEVSTGNLYWANRLIAALADAHFYETSNAIEGFAESARAYGHRLVERTDAELREIAAQKSVSESQERAGAAEITENASIAIIAKLQQSNEEMAEYLRTHVTKLLNDVLYTSSNLMHNSFAMSDRWN
jgi:dipeptidase